MPETCNRRKKCNNERYKDDVKCILHCDKLDFDAEDIGLFWQKIRQEYVQYRHPNNQINNEIIIEDVTFPKFEVFSRGQHNFFLSDYHFRNNVKFFNCTFTHDFDLAQTGSLQKIIFENCTFYENIKLAESNEIEIIDSEFKDKTSFGNQHWKNIELKSTRFFKDFTLYVSNNLFINDCQFNEKLSFNGFNTLTANIQNGECRKELAVSNTLKINIKDIKLKSNVTFQEQNQNINIEDITCEKDVSFHLFHNLSISNSTFKQKNNFSSNNFNDIVIDNTTLNDIKLKSGNSLKIINNSAINGNLQLQEQLQYFTLQNSNIVNELNIEGSKNVVIEEATLHADSCFNREYNDIFIKKSTFTNLKIGTTHTLDVYDVKVNGDFNLTGEEYQLIKIDICDISNTLKVGKVAKLELNNIKSEPTLKLTNDKYENINIKYSTFFDVDINNATLLNIFHTTINGELNLLGETNGNITFDGVILKDACTFPKINSFSLKNSEFNEKISFNHISNIEFNNSEFKNEVTFLEQSEEYVSINFEACTFYKKLKLSSARNFLKIISSSFMDEVDFSGKSFKAIEILSSTFASSLLLSSSKIEKLYISTKDEQSHPSAFKSVVDFTNTIIDTVSVNNSDFQGELKFINNTTLNLSDINNTKIKDLTIIKNLVINLFENSKNLTIAKFALEHSKLDTSNQSNEIDINNITIDTYKWNKVILLKVINFYEMNINSFTIENSNIEYRFRIKESDVGVFKLEASTFEDLQIIDNKSDYIDMRKQMYMTNTTIKNAVLDKLKYYSFKMTDAHVSEAKIGNVEFKNGSRETNRFFKNYYDSISDYIKADVYYQQEMDEHYTVSSKKYSSEWWILDFGKAVSNFGQSWIKPLVWAILFTLVLYRVANHELLSLDGFRENHISWMLNDIIKFINPFSKSSSHNYANFYWAWFVHKALMTIFTYHFLVAIKRKTKR